MTIELVNILAGGIIAILGAILRQYLILKKEIETLKLSIAKNYATVDSIKDLAQAQKEMLNQMIDIKIDIARFIAGSQKDEHKPNS